MVSNTSTSVTVDYLPPPVDALTPEHTQILYLALKEWADTCRALNLKPWLIYMPAKLRVLHSMLKIWPGQAHEFEEWKPNGLPEYIAGLAQQHGIEIIDLDPTLTMATQKGVMPYNALFDSHLSREGSLLVGKVIAARLHEGN